MRKIILFVLSGLMLMAMSGCNGNEEGNEEEYMNTEHEWDFDMEERIRKVDHLVTFSFTSDVGIPSAIFSDTAANFTEIVIVYNREDAVNYLDAVMVVWPRAATKHMIEALNIGLATSESFSFGKADLEQFGLEYPITLENVVEDWEKVHAFWSSVSCSTQRGSVSALARRLAEQEREAQEAAAAQE